MKKLIYLCIGLLLSSSQLLAQKTVTGTITDEKGSTYMRSEFVLNNRGKQELDVSQLKPGVYYLHLRTANTDQVLKFLKL